MNISESQLSFGESNVGPQCCFQIFQAHILDFNVSNLTSRSLVLDLSVCMELWKLFAEGGGRRQVGEGTAATASQQC